LDALAAGVALGCGPVARVRCVVRGAVWYGVRCGVVRGAVRCGTGCGAVWAMCGAVWGVVWGEGVYRPDRE
jgi:predicted membrane protein